MDGALVLLLHDGLAISWNSAKVNHSHTVTKSLCDNYASNPHKYTVNEKALQLCAVYKKLYLNYKSHQNP